MNDLKKGMKGSLVSAAQLSLKRSGFYLGSLDGDFGAKTEVAVKYFQRANMQKTDGIIGRKTWALMEKYLTGYFEYALKRGDTYWLLAHRYATSIDAIRLANPEINAEFLKIGQKIIIPFGFHVVTAEIPYSYELTRLIVKGLSVRYPFLKLNSIGRSVLGREIFLIEAGSGENIASFNGAHHANEWITVPVILKFLEQYAASYAFENNERIKKLFETTKLLAVPLVNPDGVDLVTGAINENSTVIASAKAISAKYPNIPYPRGWKANIVGTDLNLNYPAMWEKAREIKFSQGFTTPAPRDFVGKAPLCAPESRAMAEFTENSKPQLILAYHSQGEIIYWKYLDYSPPRDEEIVNALSKVSGYTPEYTPENSSYAGYKDWFIASFKLPGYTIEVGKGTNPLPLSQFDKIYRDNKALMLEALAQIL